MIALGSAWSRPFDNLGDALLAASSGDTIRVGLGTYYFPTPFSANHTYNVPDGVTILGGYWGNSDNDANYMTCMAPLDSPDSRDPLNYATIFEGNGGGGHVYNVFTVSSATVSFDGFSITGGIAEDTGSPGDSGGGIHADGSTLTLTNVRIVDNHTPNNGGGIALYDCDMTMTNCFLGKDTADDSGGAIYCLQSHDHTVLLFEVTIGGMSIAGNKGAGIYFEGPDTDCLLHTRRLDIGYGTGTDGDGGGVYLDSGSWTDTNSKFAVEADTNGGGVFIGLNAVAQITNGQFFGNSANLGSAVFVAGECTLINCTLTHNDCFLFGQSDSKGAIYVDTTGVVDVKNSIVWNNSRYDGIGMSTEVDQDAGLFIASGGTATVTYSDVTVDPPTTAWSGTGNIADDPMFDGSTIHLTSCSPCIDAAHDADMPQDSLNVDGDMDTTELTPLDVENQQRFVDMDLTGDSLDMGAWERTCPADVDDGNGMGVHDGGVGSEDLIYYLIHYGLGDSHADLDDGSGTGCKDSGVGSEDLLFFLAHYNAGC